jgi:hypothetical protein
VPTAWKSSIAPFCCSTNGCRLIEPARRRKKRRKRDTVPGMGTSEKPAENVELHAFTNLDRARI